jgi:hypothetical protein
MAPQPPRFFPMLWVYLGVVVVLTILLATHGLRILHP